VREAAAHREPVEIITSDEAGACPALIVDGAEVAVPAGQDPEVVGSAVAAAEARRCGHPVPVVLIADRGSFRRRLLVHPDGTATGDASTPPPPVPRPGLRPGLRGGPVVAGVALGGGAALLVRSTPTAVPGEVVGVRYAEPGACITVRVARDPQPSAGGADAGSDEPLGDPSATVGPPRCRPGGARSAGAPAGGAARVQTQAATPPAVGAGGSCGVGPGGPGASHGCRPRRQAPVIGCHRQSGHGAVPGADRPATVRAAQCGTGCAMTVI
jgi:hypothetical protein